MNIRKNLLKNATDSFYRGHGLARRDCVSDLSHKIICGHNLTASNEELPIIDRIPLCQLCYPKIHHDYNLAVNDGFMYGLEVYLDSYVEKQIEIITNASCDHPKYISGHEVKDISKSILADLRASLKEKIYTPTFKNAVQAQKFLNKQGCRIEESANKNIIKFSMNRDILLPDEVKALSVIAKEKGGIMIPDFENHAIIIRKETNTL